MKNRTFKLLMIFCFILIGLTTITNLFIEKTEKIYAEDQEPEIVEVWVLNNTITLPDDVDSSFTIDFLSSGDTEVHDNKDYNSYTIFEGVKYTSISVKSSYLVYKTINSVEDYSYAIGGWQQQRYRALYFYAAPTGNLKTWLEANGTKVTHYHDGVIFNRPMNNDDFNALISNSNGKIPESNYYFTEDIVLDHDIKSDNNSIIRICLNGHVLNLNGDHDIKNFGDFYIYNCDNSTVHKFDIDENKNATLNESSGTTIINGGIVTGFNCTKLKGIFNYYSDEFGNLTTGSGGVKDNRVLYIDNVTFVGNKCDIQTSLTTENRQPPYGTDVYTKCFGLIVGDNFVLNNVTFRNNSYKANISRGTGFTSESLDLFGGFIKADDLTANNVSMFDNMVEINFDAQNNGASIYGGLIYTKGLFQTQGLYIYENNIKTNNVTSIIGGLIHFDYIKNSDLTIANLEIHDNNINVESIYPLDESVRRSEIDGIVYLCSDNYSEKTITYESLKVYNNKFIGDVNHVYGTFNTTECILNNAEIYDNEATSNNITRESFGGFLVNKTEANLKGKIIIKNNTINDIPSDFFGEDYDALEYSYFKIDNELDNGSSIYITFDDHLNDNNKFVVGKGTKASKMLTDGVLKTDDPRYYLSTKDGDIYINGRIKSNPTIDNNYKFDLYTGDYDGTFKYQWYRVIGANEVLLENNTNATLDLTHQVIGTYKCITTLEKDSNTDAVINSIKVELMPSIIEQPTDSNQYYLNVDTTGCEENSVSITYEWYTVEENPDQLIYFTDENTTKQDEPYIPIPIGGTYDDSTNLWMVDEGYILDLLFDVSAGDTIVISSFMEAKEAIPNIILFGNKGGSFELIFFQPYKSLCIDCTANETIELVMYAYDLSENMYPFKCSIGKVDSKSPIDDEKVTCSNSNDILVMLDEEMFSPVVKSADDGVYSLSADGGIIEVDLVANETIYVEATQGMWSCVYTSIEDVQAANSIYCIMDIYNGDKKFAFTAIEAGTYYFVFMCVEQDINIYTIGGTTYTKIEGQTNNHLQASEENVCVGYAIYDDGIDTYTAISETFNFDPSKATEPEVYVPILLIPHDVIFHNLEGINMELPTSIEFQNNISLEDIKPTKQGYIFEGFYRDSNYKYKVDTLVYNIVEEVYAKWSKEEEIVIEPKTYNITYILNEGIITSSTYTTTIKENDTIINLPIVVKEGYTLDGYYINDSKIIDNTISSINSDITITIKWIKNETPITYTNTQLFVGRVYRTFLRDIVNLMPTKDEIIEVLKDDPDGTNYWVDELDRGIQQGNTFVYNLFLSNEYQLSLSKEGTILKQYKKFVEDVYRAMQGRLVEQIGLDYWVNDLVNGQTYKQVIDNIARSKEFNNICKEYNIKAIKED